MRNAIMKLLQRRAGVFALFLALGLCTGVDQAWTDDARFYVPAAAAYGAWLQDAATGTLRLDARAFSQVRLDRAFAVNHEHPPVGKYAMALGWLIFHRWTGLFNEIAACRLAVVALWAGMCAVLVWLVAAQAGWASGWFAGLALAFLPRVLFDGHAETLDAPVAALIFFSFVATWRCLEAPSWRRGAAAVVLFSLALGAKLNAPFFLTVLFAYLVLLTPLRREGLFLRLPPLPWVALALVTLSPLLALLLWPWLWFDTAARLSAYLHFHLQHYGILFYYQGSIYENHVAPPSAPWVMAAATLPLPILALALAGAWRPAWTLLGQLPLIHRPDLSSNTALRTSPCLRLGLFALLQALTHIGSLSLPGVPLYGGVKLLLPAFPFVALLAGLAFHEIACEIAAVVSPRFRAHLVLTTAALLLLPGILGAWTYRGYWLSYYSEAWGGVRGAAAAGYERQYYDLAYPQIARLLRARLPSGGKVAVLPNPKEYGPYLTWWSRDRAIPNAIHLVDPSQADVLLLTHESRWPQYPEIIARYRSAPLIGRIAVAGVPLVSLFDLRASRH